MQVLCFAPGSEIEVAGVVVVVVVRNKFDGGFLRPLLH